MNRINIPLILVFLSMILSLALHCNNLSNDIQGVHTWRQSQTMWNVRNFVRHDNNILNARVSHFNANPEKTNIYRYEFPVYQWIIANAMRIFGEHILIARLLTFLIGCFSVFGFYKLLLEIEIGKFSSAIGAILFQFSPLFFTYTINILPDLFALCFAIWYCHYFFIFTKTEKSRYLSFAIICLMIATLAKLPYIIFGVLSFIFFLKVVFIRHKEMAEKLSFLWLHFILLSPVFAWYIWVIPGWKGNPVLTGILSGFSNIGEIKYITCFHIMNTIPLILMNPITTVLFILGFYLFLKQKSNFKIYIWAIMAITLIYWLSQYNTIHIHHDYYLLPLLVWIYIIIGYSIQFISKTFSMDSKYHLTGIVIISIILTTLITENKWDKDLSFGNQDLLSYKEQLKTAVPDSSLVIILNDPTSFVFSYQIDKMGYVFKDDHLPASWIEDMITNNDVGFMYSDSRVVDENPDVQVYLDSLILKAGSIHVYKLKSSM